MAVNLKQYAYSKGVDGVLDADFAAAKPCGRVRPGKQAIFWRSGLRWCVLPVSDIQRIYRRIQPVYGKLCCGGRSYFIEWLVLVQHSGEELVIRVGDDMSKEAEALLQTLRELHPHLQYGKV